MLRVYSAVLFFCYLFFVQRTYSQEYSGTFNTYFSQDGLADNIINDLIVDNQGVLWVATPNGLTRFDNFNFISFHKKNSEGFFSNNSINELAKSDSGIFLISNLNGLIHLNTATFKFSRITEKGILSFFTKSDTSLLFFCDASLEVRVKNKVIAKRSFKKSSYGSVILYGQKIYFIDEFSKLLILNSKDLITIKSLAVATFKPNGRLSLSKKYGFVYHSGENVFIPSNNGNLILHPNIEDRGEVTFYREDESGNEDYIQSFKIPNINYSPNYLKMRFDKMLNAQIRCLYRFSNDCIFLGTNQGLFKDFRRVNISKPWRDDFLFTQDIIRVHSRMIQDIDSSVYLLGYPGVVKVKEPDMNLFFPSKINFSDALIINSKFYFVDRDSGVWEYPIRSGKISNKFPKRKYFTIEKLNSIYQVNDENVILTGLNKLIYWNVSTGSNFCFQFSDNLDIFKIFHDTKNNLFFLASNKGVYTFSIDGGNRIELDSTIYLKNVRVNDLYFDQDKHHLWLATEKGIVKLLLDNYQVKSQFYFDSLAINPVAFAITKDKAGFIWSSGSNGITFIDPISNEVKHLTKDHGIVNNEFIPRSVLNLMDGRILFGGLNAYDLINPEFMKFINYTSNFSISCVEKISLDGNRNFLPINDSLNFFEFKSGKEDLILYLRNNDYINSLGYKFEYSLDGSDWQELMNHPKIHVSNLPEGENTLLIRMRDPFGKIVAKKNITILSKFPFYQKRVFYLLIILVLIVLCFLFIYLFKKILSIEKNTKSRIAMDLHDETGTILTRISMLIQSRLDLNAEKEIIKNDLGNALFSLRSFIDSMQVRNYTVLELNDEFAFLVQEQMKNTSINFQFNSCVSERINVSGELFRDMKLCLYELLNNVVKHSLAKNCIVSVKIRQQKILLQLVDDGVLKSISDLNSKGNGIRNVRKRVKRNNGTFNAWVSDNTSGLRIEISFAL